jgi:triphosphoribosyl-dephospho-CoA synthase
MSARASVRARCLGAFREACRYDVLAFKPGNVSLSSPGHGMEAADFLRSAAAATPCLMGPAGRVGRDILHAMRATHKAVGCNTNLGILLLAAPLLTAAPVLFDTPRSPQDGLAHRLRASLRGVLAATTQEDSADVFAAIRLANPGGLGSAPDEDVRGTPRLALQEVMRLAAHRDRIAAQYITGYRDVFALGLSCLERRTAAGAPLADAVTDCYLAFLSQRIDSHVLRKWGRSMASRVRVEASAVTAALKACENPTRRMALLSTLDRALKRESLNPGTSADLTVASLLAFLLIRSGGSPSPVMQGSAGT